MCFDQRKYIVATYHLNLIKPTYARARTITENPPR